MYEQFSKYLLQNKLQKWYIGNVINRRNEYSNKAFTTPINRYFTNYKEDTSPLDLVYHGLSPLYATGKILVDPSLKFEEVKLERISDIAPNEQVIKLYEITLETIENGLKQWSIDTVEGDLEEVRGKPEEFKRRLGIITMHGLNHIAQALRFQGLICLELAAEN